MLCIQPAATNLDSTTSSRTSFSCRRSQELDEHKCETVLLHVLYQPTWSQNQKYVFKLVRCWRCWISFHRRWFQWVGILKFKMLKLIYFSFDDMQPRSACPYLFEPWPVKDVVNLIITEINASSKLFHYLPMLYGFCCFFQTPERMWFFLSLFAEIMIFLIIAFCSTTIAVFFDESFHSPENVYSVYSRQSVFLRWEKRTFFTSVLCSLVIKAGFTRLRHDDNMIDFCNCVCIYREQLEVKWRINHFLGAKMSARELE